MCRDCSQDADQCFVWPHRDGNASDHVFTLMDWMFPDHAPRRLCSFHCQHGRELTANPAGVIFLAGCSGCERTFRMTRFPGKPIDSAPAVASAPVLRRREQLDLFAEVM